MYPQSFISKNSIFVNYSNHVRQYLSDIQGWNITPNQKEGMYTFIFLWGCLVFLQSEMGTKDSL
ncbi:MAG: hypothetical protein XD49_1893 [Caldanaerobacter subterraneus]|nr:MAG: hypothetical protein XD49_1893 [Caldanaerobacter subterraneus]